ncbi:MAG: SpoIIE family protein phosphatase [Clostridia bacterium]|nr:SpoIIE family protein phosphatase [Clostridia bacterium]
MVLENEQYTGERVNLRPSKFGKIEKIFKYIFNSMASPYILLLLLTAGIEVLGGQPFAFVLLGIATIFNIPLLVPLITTVISFIVFKEPTTMYVTYLITYFIYLISTVLISVEGTTKKYSTMTRLIISFAVSSLLIMIFTGFSRLALLQFGINALVIFALYPVFTSGCSMLFNIRKNLIFSKEEIISFGVLIATAITLLSSTSIMGFSLSNVLIVVLIVIIAWKNDWVIGTATGVVIGLIYSLITGESTLVIVSCGFSGLIAGILSRFGKLPVIIAFAIGNVTLSYLYTKDIELWARLAEILVASGVIIALPKKAILKFEEIFNTSNSLPAGYENQLGPANEMKSRIGAIGEVFDNLASITIPVSEETVLETENVIKKYLLDHKKNECISCKEKISCLQEEEIAVVAKHIAKRLEDNKSLTKEMLPVSCGMADEMITDIIEIYNNMKLMRVIRMKENEMNSKLAEEYQVVSKLLKKISKHDTPKLNDITNQKQKRIREELGFLRYSVYEDAFYEDERDVSYEFVTDILTDIEKAKREIQTTVSKILNVKMSIKMILNSSKTEKSRIKLVPSSKYIINAVVKQIKKIDSPVNGDSYIVTELRDNNKIIAVSDGMGSGPKSKEISMSVINMIDSLSASGISKTDILNITNKVVKSKENGTVSATLDMCILNEKKESLEFVKLGAVPSYVLSDGIVEKIECKSDSFGVADEVVFTEYDHNVKRNMYVIMTSDGAISDINQKILQEIVDENQEKFNESVFMEKIMEKIIDSQNKLILDDITVVVAKIS